MSSQNLILGLPKGSLQNATLDLFEKAGWNIYVSSRSYRPTSDDKELELRLIRAQEIGRYVDHGFLDCGITGKDWIAENRADVEVICDLGYSRASTNPTRWVLVVPEDSPIQTVQDLEGKRIATESVGLTTDFLKSKGVNAEVEFSWGATEVKVPELVDAIVDVKKIPELTELKWTDSHLVFGAATPCYVLYEDPKVCEKFPGIIDSAFLIGGIQIQSRASLGGNLCNASPSADGICS